MSDDLHQLRIEPVEAWAERSADLLAEAIGAALSHRDHCLVALSGGSTPAPAFAALATRELDWDRVVLLQADERLVAPGPDRNLTQQRAAFADLGATWLPLPVDRLLAGQPADETLADFSAQLVEIADEPPVIDVAHLGLGVDGHTASLLPGDPAVDELRHYVALTGPHGGYRRLTMTRPVFDRARLVVWLARGSSKAGPLGRLLAGDLSIPAGKIRPRQSVIVADTDAARQS